MSTAATSRGASGAADRDSVPGPRVSYLIKRVEQGSRSLIDEQLQDFGVTLNQYTALSVLRLRAGLSSAELSRRSFVTPQAMNQVVAVLETRGLLVREPDPAHRKILRAYLTPAGNRLLDQCDAVIDEAERRMLQGVTANQLKAFSDVLLRCSAALDGMHRLRGTETGQE